MIELRCLVKYFKVLGIFFWKLVVDVELYMISEILSGILLGFVGFDNILFFGMICMCMLFLIVFEVFMILIWRYLVFMVVFL